MVNFLKHALKKSLHTVYNEYLEELDYYDDIVITRKGFSVTDNGDTYHVVLSVTKESDGCTELEQFKNLADDYNIPFDSFYDVIEKLLVEE